MHLPQPQGITLGSPVLGKIITTLSLHDFDVEGGEKEHVINDLKSMILQIQESVHAFINSPAYQDLADRILSGQFKTRYKNSCGRGVVPKTVFPCNSSAMNDMLRGSTMSHIESYAMSCGLFSVLRVNPNETNPKKIRELFKEQYPHSKVPHYYEITSHIHRFHNKKQSYAALPGSQAKIHLSDSDGHYLKLTHTNQEITLSFRRLYTAGMWVKLKFTIPKNERFLGDKVSKPSVQLVGDKLVFSFAIASTVPDIKPTRVMGVDLGKVEPFIATVIDESMRWHSAPFFASGKIKDLSRKYADLMDRAAVLKAKEERCLASGHGHKADTLAAHRQGIGSKARRIKNEVMHLIGHEVAEIAYQMNARVVMENLSWLSSAGGMWNFREIQEAITNSCARKGVPVKCVSAKDTSNTCTRCGAGVRHIRRDNVCVSCGFRINRDVAASREIALRGTTKKLRGPLRQRRHGVPVSH